jgi:hypothetical protein
MALKAFIVAWQSCPINRLFIRLSPLAMDESMTALWDMDLSPGTVILPRNERGFFIFIIY